MPDAHRSRDPAATSARLLGAARELFTTHGYASTTVRAIARRAGVNVSLVNRYFGSKQGLYAACLDAAAHSLEQTAIRAVPPDAPPGPTGSASGDRSSFADIADMISRQAVRTTSDAEPQELLLLVRPADDAAAEQVRSEVLARFAAEIAAAAQGSDTPGASTLGAQLVLAFAAGVAMLRTNPGLEQLNSATGEQLLGPVRAVVATLLYPRT